MIANTLIVMAHSPKFEQLMENGYINGIVNTGIDILCVLAPENDF